MTVAYILSEPLVINKGDDVQQKLDQSVADGKAKRFDDPVAIKLIEQGWNYDAQHDVWRNPRLPYNGFTFETAIEWEGL